VCGVSPNSYQLICLISRPLLIASRCDWYLSKGLLKGFKLALRSWESSKNWWRYDQMKFVTFIFWCLSLPVLWGSIFSFFIMLDVWALCHMFSTFNLVETCQVVSLLVHRKILQVVISVNRMDWKEYTKLWEVYDTLGLWPFSLYVVLKSHIKTLMVNSHLRVPSFSMTYKKES